MAILLIRNIKTNSNLLLQLCRRSQLQSVANVFVYLAILVQFARSSYRIAKGIFTLLDRITILRKTSYDLFKIVLVFLY